MRLNYPTRKGLYLGSLLGGSLGAGVLWATGHSWLAGILLLTGAAAAVFLAIEERWQSERDES